MVRRRGRGGKATEFFSKITQSSQLQSSCVGNTHTPCSSSHPHGQHNCLGFTQLSTWMPGGVSLWLSFQGRAGGPFPQHTVVPQPRLINMVTGPCPSPPAAPRPVPRAGASLGSSWLMGRSGCHTAQL
jgi:hypothetical protein